MADMDKVLSNINFEKLLCRDLGHTWKPYTVFRYAKGYVRTLRCPRCHTERVSEMDKYGHIIKSWYRYERGYLIEGLGRMSMEERAHIRLTVLDAVAVDAPAD